MKRENGLRKRLHSLEMLTEAVGAMKSLSAHHLRSARAALDAARTYRAAAEQALACIGLPKPSDRQSQTALLVFASDLGLCGSYNSQLTATAIDRLHHEDVVKVYGVGSRATSAFQRAAVKVENRYEAPSSVDGINTLLLRLAEDLMSGYLTQEFQNLDVVSARFEGVGKFTPVVTRLLPIEPGRGNCTTPPSLYVSLNHLRAVAIREYLFIRLYETLLDALASEHGARLVATESANEWLNEKRGITTRQLTATRREAATQEVLEIATMARRRNEH